MEGDSFRGSGDKKRVDSWYLEAYLEGPGEFRRKSGIPGVAPINMPSRLGNKVYSKMKRDTWSYIALVAYQCYLNLRPISKSPIWCRRTQRLKSQDDKSDGDKKSRKAFTSYKMRITEKNLEPKFSIIER
jgi:hypothetical protein